MNEQSISSSKTGSIRSLLMKAWRERYTDIQWGIHIKTVLPRYISGDIYHLSDCILQQALMGPLPNNLILSYLRHSLYSQIVSYGGVLESISKYDGFRKPHCIHSLLLFVQSMMVGTSSKGKPEDCLSLATSLVSIVKWLVQVMGWSTQELIDLKTAPEHTSNLNLAASILIDMVNSPFISCMLDIGQWEDRNLWKECTNKMVEAETLLSHSVNVVKNANALINTIIKVRENCPVNFVYRDQKPPVDEDLNSFGLHTLVMLEVNYHPTADASKFAQQLMLVQKLKGMDTTDLYVELLESCFVGLSSPEYLPHQELKWVGFTFIKVPNIVEIIHANINGDSHTLPSEELLSAVKQVSLMTAILDMADTKNNCNCLEYLLYEFFNRKKLLTERDAQVLLAMRKKESSAIPKPDNVAGNPVNPVLVIKAQSTREEILNELNTRPPDNVLPVMGKLIGGRSGELIMTAAAASGSLQHFTQRIVSLNEQSLEPQPSETGQMAKNRALMFDYSFLLLCYIAQTWGIESVVTDKCDTFIEQWMKDNMPEVGKTKNPPYLSVKSDTEPQDFLRQFSGADSENQYINVRWGEVCQTATIVFREALNAVVAGDISQEHANNLLDRLTLYLCSFPISIAAWISSYIQTANSVQSNQAHKFIQHLQSKINSDPEGGGILDCYKDRSLLMYSIVDNMVRVVKGNSTELSECLKESMECDNTKGDLLLMKMLQSTWTGISSQSGLMNHKALATCKQLMLEGGTQTFVNSLVKAALDNVFIKDLMTSIDIVYGLFHFDICECTYHLLIHTLPLYISGPSTLELLCERRINVLAKLTMMSVVSAWLTAQENAASQSRYSVYTTTKPKSRKRPYYDLEFEDLEKRLCSQLVEMDIEASDIGKDGMYILVAVHSLFKQMAGVARSGVISPVTHLIVAILSEMVATPETFALLKLLPHPLLTNLLPILTPPHNFSYQQLLALSAPRPRSDNMESQNDLILNQSSSQQAASRRTAAKLLCLNRSLELLNMSLI